MQSTNQGKRYFSVNEEASTATRRDGLSAKRKAAMEAWAGSGVLVLLFLASLAYVGFGGTLALEASPVPEAEASMAEASVITADAGGAARTEIPSGSSTAAVNYFPSGYVNGGRAGDGNVMTYEHD